MNKKGFTLIELLAVIVILAVITLIVTPIVTGVVEEVKAAANLRSAEGYVKAGENFYNETLLDTAKASKLGTNVIDDLSLSGKKATGELIVDKKGKVSMAIVLDNSCYIKDRDNTNIDVSTNKDNCFAVVEPPESCFTTYAYKDGVEIKEYLCGKDDSEQKYYNIIIPSKLGGKDVTGVGYEAFKDNNLNSVIFPESIIRVDDYAFYKNKLTRVQLNDGLVELGKRSFEYNSLKKINIPNSVTKVEDEIFKYNLLESINIPTSITKITSGMFYHNNLVSIDIPSNITEIASAAFRYNSISSATIPNSVTNLGTCVFEDNKIASLVVPGSITSIPNYAFANNKIKDITIESGINQIDMYAFYNNLIEKLTLPDTITQVGNYAFIRNKITDLKVSNKLTEIGYEAFNDNLLPDDQAYIYLRNSDGTENKTTVIGYGGSNKDITLPSNITTIADLAFANNALTSVVIPSTVTSIGAEPFNGNNMPDDKAFIYKRNSDGTDDRTVLISYGGSSTEVVVPSNVKVLGTFSIADAKLTNITLPDGLTTIESEALGNNKFAELFIPNSVTTIAEYALDNNPSLTSIKIDNKSGSISNDPWGAYNARITYLR